MVRLSCFQLLHEAGDIAAVVSGGFLEVITPIMRQLGIEDYLANIT
jgi:phosphoserine phosphatase